MSARVAAGRTVDFGGCCERFLKGIGTYGPPLVVVGIVRVRVIANANWKSGELRLPEKQQVTIHQCLAESGELSILVSLYESAVSILESQRHYAMISFTTRVGSTPVSF